MFEFIFLFLAWLTLLGPWGWLGLILVSALIVTSLEKETGVGAAGSVVLGLVLVWFFNGHAFPTVSGVLGWLDEYWFKLIFYAGAYVLLGIGWAVAKWWFYLHDVADRIAASYSNQDARKRWKDVTALRFNKARITTWMTYWPWSAAWTLFRDPVKRAFTFAYERMGRTYERIADSVFASRFPDAPKNGS